MATNEQDFLARLNAADSILTERARERAPEPEDDEERQEPDFEAQLAAIDSTIQTRNRQSTGTRFSRNAERERSLGIGTTPPPGSGGLLEAARRARAESGLPPAEEGPISTRAARVVQAENIRQGRTESGVPTRENIALTEALQEMDPAERAVIARDVVDPERVGIGTGDLDQGNQVLATATPAEMAIGRAQAFSPLAGAASGIIETAGTLGSYIADPFGLLAGPSVRRGVQRRAAIRDAVIEEEGEGRGLETLGTGLTRIGGELLVARRLPGIGRSLAGGVERTVASRPLARALVEGAAGATTEGFVAHQEGESLEDTNRRMQIAGLLGAGVGGIAGRFSRRAERAAEQAASTRRALEAERLEGERIREGIEGAVRGRVEGAPRRLPPGRPGTPEGATVTPPPRPTRALPPPSPRDSQGSIIARPVPIIGPERQLAVRSQAEELAEATAREFRETRRTLSADEIEGVRGEVEVELRGSPADRAEAPRPPNRERRARLRQRLSDPETLQAENRELRSQLEESFRDELTGLPGENAFRRALGRIEADPDMDVVSFDMANLGRANDVSPQFGDQRLSEVADAMRQVAEDMGIPIRNLFRRGGDEFAAAVPKSQSKEFARRVEFEFGVRDIPLPDTQAQNFIRSGVAQTAEEADRLMQGRKASETVRGKAEQARGGSGAGAFEDPAQGRLFAGVPTGIGRALTARSGGAVAGGVAGGQAGVAEAEERGINPAVGALVGGATGAAVGFVAGAGASRAAASTFFRRNFTVPGLLPEGIFERKVLKDAQTRGLLQQIRFTARDFNRALREAYGSINNVTRAEMDQIDQVLKGDAAPSTIPAVLRPMVRRMRLEIDALSQRLIDEGIVEGELAARVAANKGFYTTRAYQVFDDPRWMKKVDEAVVNKAKAWLRQRNPQATEEQIKGTIDRLLNPKTDSPLGFVRGQQVGSKDLSILRRRGDIAPEIRALWGEIKDPMLNYTRSVEKMVRLLENESFLRDMRKEGLGTFFFEQPVSNASGQFITRIASEGSKRMAPLDGLYTTPEIAQGLQDAVEGLGDVASWLRPFMAVNAAVKFNKTVGSLMTHVRNTVGNVGFAVANGHWRLAAGPRALQTTLSSLDIPAGIFNGRLGIDSEASRSFYRKMQDLGVINESANVGELSDAIRDFTRMSDVDVFDGLPARFSRRLRPAARTTGDALRGLQELYRAEDDVWKIYAWLNETARYRNALPDVGIEEIERRAANIVRNTYPTYSLVPRGIRALRRFPLLGTFVSFPAEVARTAKNTVGLAMKELADPNPAIKAIGAQRLTGIMLAAGGTGVASQYSQFVNGITPDEDEYVRTMIPPWSANSELFYLNKDAEGNYEYIDIGYSDPYSYIKRVAIAAMRGESIEDSAMSAAIQAAEPFLGEDIMAGKLLDIARNRRRGTTNPVFNPQDSFEQKTLDIMAHLWDAIEPGTISSAQRIYDGIAGRATIYGETYDPRVEATAVLTGQRRSVLDPIQSLQFKTREFGRKKADATSIFTRQITSRGEVSDSELELAFRSMLDARVRNYTDLIDAIEGTMVHAGSTREELYSVLRANNVSEQEAAFLINGVMPPLEVSNQSLSNLIQSQIAGLQSGTTELEERGSRASDRIRLWLELVRDANTQTIPGREGRNIEGAN